MNRVAGIIVAAIGLIVAVLSILKFVPGLVPTGVILILFGGLIIGLSFIDGPDDEGTERMSTPGTLVNILFSPSDVFRNLRRHPRFLVALLIMSGFSAIFTNMFLYRLTPERVTNYAIDKTLEISFLNDDARKQIESGRQKAIDDQKNPVLRAAQVVTGFAAAVFGFAFLGLIFFLFALAMGGKINYWQAFSSAVYAAFPVSVIRFILNSVLLFLKDPSDIHPITGQTSLIQDNLNFLVLPSDHPVIYTILGTLSVLTFYWVWLNGTGLKNAGEKVTGTIAWSAALTVYFALLLFGAVMALIFPGFIS